MGRDSSASSKVDAYMPLFIADYLVDTTDLSTEEHGAYLLLLMNLWKRNGRLPFDHARIARIVGLPLDRWVQTWETLARFFDVDEEGHLVHGRVSAEIEKAQAMARRKSDAGRSGAAGRWQPQCDRIAPAIPPANAVAVAEAMRSQWQDPCDDDGENMPSHPQISSPEIREKPTVSSSEPVGPASEASDEISLTLVPVEPTAAPVVILPCLGAQTFGVVPNVVAKYSAMYPAIDVVLELRKLGVWLETHPERRSKGAKGTLQRIARWMDSAHERQSQGPKASATHASPRFAGTEQRQNGGPRAAATLGMLGIAQAIQAREERGHDYPEGPPEGADEWDEVADGTS